MASEKKAKESRTLGLKTDYDYINHKEEEQMVAYLLTESHRIVTSYSNFFPYDPVIEEKFPIVIQIGAI